MAVVLWPNWVYSIGPCTHPCGHNCRWNRRNFWPCSWHCSYRCTSRFWICCCSHSSCRSSSSCCGQPFSTFWGGCRWPCRSSATSRWTGFEASTVLPPMPSSSGPNYVSPSFVRQRKKYSNLRPTAAPILRNFFCCKWRISNSLKKVFVAIWAAAMAPWFHLHLPFWGPGFESQAHHLLFFQFMSLKLNSLLEAEKDVK